MDLYTLVNSIYNCVNDVKIPKCRPNGVSGSRVRDFLHRKDQGKKDLTSLCVLDSG